MNTSIDPNQPLYDAVFDQEQEVINAAGELISYELRQLLLKSRNPHAKDLLEKFEVLTDEWDALQDKVDALREAVRF